MRAAPQTVGAVEPQRVSSAAARPGELAVAAALLSAGAAAIHAAVAGPHFDEYVPFGVLFIASALGQAVWAALVLVSPPRRLLVAAIVGNAGIVVAWAVSRTIGMPLGPEPWTAEPISALDFTATMFELGVIAASGLLLLGRGARTALSSQGIRRFAAAGAAAIVVLTGTAFSGSAGGADHDEAPAQPPGASVPADRNVDPSTRSRTQQAQKPVAPRSSGTAPGAAQPANAHVHAAP